MLEFKEWLGQNVKSQPRFISDNNGFDWQFVNWYFHHFLGKNPFGFSSQNLGSLYKGLARSMFVNFKHLRKTSTKVARARTLTLKVRLSKAGAKRRARLHRAHKHLRVHVKLRLGTLVASRFVTFR